MLCFIYGLGGIFFHSLTYKRFPLFFYNLYINLTQHELLTFNYLLQVNCHFITDCFENKILYKNLFLIACESLKVNIFINIYKSNCRISIFSRRSRMSLTTKIHLQNNFPSLFPPLSPSETLVLTTALVYLY